MKVYPLLFLLFLVTNFAFSQQSWPAQGASWHYDFDSFFHEGYIHIYADGDTLVNGKSCTLLQKVKFTKNHITKGVDTTIMPPEIVYSEGGKVFNFRHGSFYTLYDFGALAGHSWLVAGDPELPHCADSDSTHITEVTQEIYNGLLYKRLHTQQKQFGDDWGFTGDIVERIGCLGYMFPEAYCLTDAEIGGKLRCYEDDDVELLQFGTTPCDYISTITELDGMFGLQLFPNPSTSTITVRGPKGNWTLYTSSGKIIQSGYKDELTYELDISSLPKGLYLLQLGAVKTKVIRE